MLTPKEFKLFKLIQLFKAKRRHECVGFICIGLAIKYYKTQDIGITNQAFEDLKNLRAKKMVFFEGQTIEKSRWKQLWITRSCRVHIPVDVQRRISLRDEGRCAYCWSFDDVQIDHIIPHSKGGSSEEENLQLLCKKCNRKKWDKISSEKVFNEKVN